MKDEVCIEFDGRLKDRQVFLGEFKLRLMEFLDYRVHKNVTIMFFREMVKNIYDHAQGMGKVTLVKAGSGICFVVEDFGCEAHDLECLVKSGSSKAGNGINFGIGLSLIIQMATDLEVVNFTIDCSRGFKYSGIYPYIQVPA